MPLRPPPKTAAASFLLGRELLMVLLVAPLVAVVWWFSPNAPASAPMGRAEEVLRAEANTLLQLPGHNAAHQACKYWAKLLRLTCFVRTSELPRITESFIRNDWTEAKSHSPQNGEFAYVRAKESARIKCPEPESQQGCAVYLFYPR